MSKVMNAVRDVLNGATAEQAIENQGIKLSPKAQAKLAAEKAPKLPQHVEGAAKHAKEEADAKAANNAKLANRPTKAREAKPLRIGSGSAVGVAAGAMDGQPHTKLAVEQARKRANVAAPQPMVKAKGVDGKMGEYPANAVYAGQFYGNATRAQDAKLRAEAAAKQAEADKKAGKEPKAKAAKEPKPAKVAAPKAEPKADLRKISKVVKENPYKPETKAAATFELFRKAKTVAEFRALVAQKPEAYDPGYIRYSSRDGYIQVG